MKARLIAAAVAAALTVGIVGPAIAHDGLYQRTEWRDRADWRRHQEWERRQAWERQQALERQRAWERRQAWEHQRQRQIERQRIERERARWGKINAYCSGRPRTLEEAAWRHRNC